MNPLLKSVLLAIIAFVAGYALCYRLEVMPERALEKNDRSGAEWMRKEFHLSPEQFATVRKIDADFAGQSEQMYARLNVLYTRANSLIAQNHGLTPEVEAALRDCTLLQEESCRTALRHMYAIAAQLPPQEGDRYIKTLQPHILEPAVRFARAH